MIKAFIRRLEVIRRAVAQHNALLFGANHDVSVALFSEPWVHRASVH